GLGPTDGVRISVDTSGMVDVVTGGASLGQGFETVMAQVAADALGVDYRRCRVIHGQTDRIPFGIGAHASRATVMTASATHIAVVRVDAETGRVAIERYWIAYDIGRAINPALVHGQIVGGYAQGVGGALFEEFTYSERGDPLAATFADYLLPALHEIPAPEVLL